MTTVREKLAEVGWLMDRARGYSFMEGFIWLQLIKHIDDSHFHRTGQIVVTDVGPQEIAESSSINAFELSSEDVLTALKRLEEKGHLVIEQRSSEVPRYRLLLPHKEAI